MSKISYSVMKKLKLDRLLKRQANFDHVIVFDDEFETKYNTINNRYYWLTFVDFCSTYKYDPNGSCIKTATYNDIVNKMNEWIKQLPQYRCRDRLQPGQPIWTIINCETLYAKIVLNFSENGEITRKRVMQYSKWPLNDELYMNLYCENNTMTQNFEQIFNGKYIVILLRIWMTKQSYYPLMLIAPSSPPPIIAIKDYWPKKITIFDDQHHSITAANPRKAIIKKIELGKKLRRTLSMESGSNNNHNNHSHNNNNNNNDDIVQNNNNGGNNHLNNHSISHAHNQPKECLEKLTHITKRINDDIINKQINGRILNLITFPCYYFKECNFNNHQNVSNEPIKDVGNKIPNGHIVNLIRVFYVLKPSVCQYENDSSDQQTPKELIGIIDFVPRCISGGGFIKYPRFETQTDIIDKATIWMTKNSQIKYLNFSSIDIKLRSMTSIDSSEMTFARNTGDFLRIIRLYYLRPYLPNENAENMNEMTTDTSLMNWKPSAPIYLQCKNIVSINNSLKELQQQMNDYLLKLRKNELQNVNHNQYQLYTGADIERWRFICVDSVSIFISNTGHSSANSSANDSRSRRNLIMADCDKSFHAITISSNHSSINRNMLNVINIYYDIGLYGRRPKSNMTLSLNDDNKQQQSMNVNATTEDKHQIDQHDQYLKSPKNCSNPTLTNSSDPNSCLIA